MTSVRVWQRLKGHRGSGLSSMEAGLRLRYEFVREFAPYIGVTWEKTFGNTHNYNPVNESNFLAGVRFWF